MSLGLALAVILAVGLAGGCSGDESAGLADEVRIERCMERVLARVEDEPVTDELRRYVRTAYCESFDRRGWVYDDGTLSIEAYRRDAGNNACATSRPGEPSTTVPCPPEKVLDCALLHLIRRSEVAAYLADVQRTREVECDDGTPLDQLGADG